MTDSQHSVPNLERALTIIELLSSERDGLSLSELIERLNIPNNSVFRITSTLRERGYLLRDEKSKRFKLSRKMLSIGYTALHDNNLLEVARDSMRELRDITGETILIATLLDKQGVVLDQLPGTFSFKFMVDPGTHFPLHSSAPGKALLSFLTEKEQVKICNRLTLTRFNERTITSLDELLKELKIVHKIGYALDRGEEHEGVHCISAPIFDYHGMPVAAVFLTGPSDRVTENMFDHLGQLIRLHANNISKSLGWNGNS